MRFIKENELKLTQVELFLLYHFMSVTANASKLFSMAYLANIEHFFILLGGYRPLLAIACQPPGTAYAVPIQIAS